MTEAAEQPRPDDSGKLDIRLAVPSDAQAIASIHVQAWQAAYAHIFPATFLAGLDVARRTEAWRQLLAEAIDVTLVAERDGAVVGWISGGLSDDADADGAAEIKAIYIAPAFWHRGIGRSLMAAINPRLPVAPHVLLWVLSENRQALDFYGALGYRPDGVRQEIERGGVRTEKLRLKNGLRSRMPQTSTT